MSGTAPLPDMYAASMEIVEVLQKHNLLNDGQHFAITLGMVLGSIATAQPHPLGTVNVAMQYAVEAIGAVSGAVEAFGARKN